MSVFNLVAFFFLMSTCAVILNKKLFKLQDSSWLMMFSMGVSCIIFILNHLVANDVMDLPKSIMTSTDMPYIFMNGGLPLLLFAGAMQMNLKSLLEKVVLIVSLTIPGALISIFVFATGLYYLLDLFHMPISYSWCVVAGSILSPTDPVSVVSVLKKLGLPAPVQSVVAGESLFNDGVAVAMFTLFVPMALASDVHHHAYNLVHFKHDLNKGFNIFLREGIGGMMTGYLTGLVASRVLKNNNDPQIVLLITITLAICTYSFASFIDTSGALAVVVAGLWMGTDYVQNAIEDKTKLIMRKFWEIIEDIINSLLFLTIGAEILLVFPSSSILPIIGLGILLSLFSRGAGVILATLPLPIKQENKNRLWSILTWGGLRGGVSIALALGLPDGHEKTILAPLAYCVVAFSIIVQGLSMEKIARKLYPKSIEDINQDVKEYQQKKLEEKTTS